MLSKHICLITPGHLATNPRLVKEADALVGAGYRVTVIASRFIGWADAADNEFNERQWTAHRVAFGRLAGRWTHLAQRVCQELAALVYRMTGLGAARAFHPVVPALSRAACAVTADLYIAHNLAALPAAAAAARLHGAKLGFDAEDFHRGEFAAAAPPTRALELTRALEDRYIPRCDHLTAASPGIGRAYARACGVREPAVVLNVFPRSEAPPSPTPCGLPSWGPRVYWFSQSLGPDRGLETAIRAIAASRSRPTLVLRGTPRAGYAGLLTDLARRHEVADRLRFLAPCAPREMLMQASQYDLGLASETTFTLNRDICLTNKIFTYLQAGLPVLASATQAQAELALGLQGAVFVYAQDDAASLAALFDQLLSDPRVLAKARATAFELGQTRFNWEVERAKFLELIAKILENR